MNVELDPNNELDSLAQQVAEKARLVARKDSIIQSLNQRVNEMEAVFKHLDLDFEEELEKLVHGHNHGVKELIVSAADAEPSNGSKDEGDS